MPLIDEQSRGTDHRSTARWPWVLVVGGLSLLWLAIAVAISLLRTFNRTASSPASAVGEFNRLRLQQAQQMAGIGQWQAAAAAVQAIDASLPMSLSDKHQYLRISAQSLVKTGSPLAGARHYERFLLMSLRIREAECAECHNKTTQIGPLRIGDPSLARLGASYAGALKAAGKLRSERSRHAAQLRRRPNDPRAHLLLQPIEASLGNRKAEAAHLKALNAYDAAQAAKQ